MNTAHNIIYGLVAIIIRTILFFTGGVDVRGKENVPMEGGVLVAANHISYLDPPLIGSVLPRRATFMARKGLFTNRALRWLIRNAAYPVDRERTRPSTIKETVRRLKAGELIVIFPEGRRNDTGELMEAKRGVGMVVSLSRVPVVPALIVGSDKVLPPDAKWLKRAKIAVLFGKPICYASIAEEKKQSKHDMHEAISSLVMSSIREMQIDYENQYRK